MNGKTGLVLLIDKLYQIGDAQILPAQPVIIGRKTGNRFFICVLSKSYAIEKFRNFGVPLRIRPSMSYALLSLLPLQPALAPVRS